MNKADLRSHLKQLRTNLSEADHRAFSQHIRRQLEAMDWSHVRLLHCFEPIAKLGEVDIDPFIVHIQKHYPNIQIYTSQRINNAWEIVVRQDHARTQPVLFDTIIVPMLGFDSRLHRIGYGGGYYDKFLATQPQTRKIGVCFELGKVDSLPDEPHDVSLDSIVTETDTY